MRAWMSTRVRYALPIAPAMLLALMAGPGTAPAQEPTEAPPAVHLDLLSMSTMSNLHGSTADVPETEPSADHFRMDLAQRIIWDADYSKTLRLAIWDSPLGRAEYEVAMGQRSLGMSGLVGAGNAFPFFARFALRDTMTQQIVLSNGHLESWHEVSTDRRVQIGVEAAVAAGALWAIFEGLTD